LEAGDPWSPRSENTTPAMVGSPLTTARVLIVDDIHSNVLLLTKILRGAGAQQVHGFTDPFEALSAYRDLEPDAVLLDLHMPGMDGIELIGRLRAGTSPDGFVPLVVLTGDVSAAAKRRVLEAGANDFLVKPFDNLEVVLRVQNLLATRALHCRVQDHNLALRRNLARQLERDRRAEELRRVRADRIRRVLVNDRLSMVYQPIVDLHAGTLVGFEALARVAEQPDRPPDQWFREAAEVGLGTELELRAVERGVRALELLSPEMFMTVNMSADVAITDELVECLASAPAERVVVELTEHAQIHDYARTLDALERLRKQGFRLAVDDAGTGYSSLQHILLLRPDIVKLDRSLIAGIDTDRAKRALTKSMVGFVAEIGAVLIAEGIEEPDELAVLRDLGVEWGQGYHLGRPGRLPSGAATANERSLVRDQPFDDDQGDVVFSRGVGKESVE
jgi:EAL domain-containing protein (putative c-di-GMP-specific phosphodiesterase class I)/AmiR/NasT family two-component response regulator